MNKLHPFEIAKIGTEKLASRRQKLLIQSYNVLTLYILAAVFLLLVNELIAGNPKGALFAFAGFSFLVFVHLLSRIGKAPISTAMFNLVIPAMVANLIIHYNGIKHVTFYFAFFLAFALLFSFSPIRKILIVIYTLALGIGSNMYVQNNGYISPFEFSSTSNYGFIIAFRSAVFLLIYLITLNSSKNEKYIDDLLRELKEKNLDLKKSNRKLEKFSQIASHDLKVPIAGIGSLVKIIEEKIQSNKLDNIHEIIEAIKNSTSQMTTMIDDTLEFGKLSFKDSISLTSMDISNIVYNLSESLKLSYPSAIIESNNLPTINCNYDLIVKLFQNLIQNGLKYNTSEVPKVSISYKIEDAYHRFTFTDNGIGIKEKDIAGIFKPYKRLHSTAQYKGTGLGLAIVKDIVKIINATIKVESEVNKGSDFILKIPIK